MEDFSEKELKKWAKEQLENGYSEKQIIDSLENAGHDSEVVSHIFSSEEPAIAVKDVREKRSIPFLTVFAVLALGISGFLIGDYIDPGIFDTDRSPSPISDCSNAELELKDVVILGDESYITYDSTHHADVGLEMDGDQDSFETVFFEGEGRNQRVPIGNFTRIEASFKDCAGVSDESTVLE